ncbi:MAG: hypothetical protein ACKOQ6_11890 [Bacteroidota bacterium]
MVRKNILLLALCFIAGCSPKNQNSERPNTEQGNVISLADMLNGLWSLDSSGFLTNHGFLLQSDGFCIAVGENKAGTWAISNSTDIEINWDVDTADCTSYKLLKMETDRMTLTSEGVEQLFRLVPFGMGEQAQVLSGFAGNLNKMRPEREYQLMLPSAKLIELRIESEDQAIGFEVFEKERPLGSKRSRTWKGVIVDPVGIKIKVSHSNPSSLDKEGFDYDLKVMGY